MTARYWLASRCCAYSGVGVIGSAERFDFEGREEEGREEVDTKRRDHSCYKGTKWWFEESQENLANRITL